MKFFRRRLPIVQRIEVLNLQPGDSLLVHVSPDLTQETLSRIREVMSDELNVHVVVLAGDVEVSAVRVLPSTEENQ